ncbi:MAG TPA: glycosyltransferase family 2 protein [Gemmatimonadales bacterium]|nr:glycosyltransferase family 2 protein [Gemmatimonadales bacterium]
METTRQPMAGDPEAGSWPLISVVTPSYNQGRFLERTIRSVLEQNYPQFEHIVMDGASTDGTIEILRRYRHLTWVSEKDSGQAAALNEGLRRARGEIIAWINSDDWYEPDIFHAVAAFFVANPDKHIVMGDCRLVDADGRSLGVLINYERGLRQLRKYWQARSIPTQPAVFFRRSLLDEFGFLDESLHYALDYDLWLRFAAKHRFYRLDRIAANYRFHPAAKGGDRDWSRFVPEWRRAYQRHVTSPWYRLLDFFRRLAQTGS